jgi:hypothetical protein
MSNYKLQISNESRSSAMGVDESRSSAMGVDECLNQNNKLRIRNTNHEYVSLFSIFYL